MEEILSKILNVSKTLKADSLATLATRVRKYAGAASHLKELLNQTDDDSILTYLSVATQFQSASLVELTCVLGEFADCANSFADAILGEDTSAAGDAEPAEATATED